MRMENHTMVNAALKSVGITPEATPQSQKAVKGQKKNAAGGFTFTVSDWDRAKRFLILGSDESYYRSGAKLSTENAKVILKLIKSEPDVGFKLVDLITEISLAGRAAKQEPGLFALALVAVNGSPLLANYAYSQLSKVARTASSLFTFMSFVMQWRKGMGSGLQKAVRRWYLDRSTDKLAYQMVKYQSRAGWSHGDLLKLSRPKSEDAVFNGLASWAIRGDALGHPLPGIVQGFEKAKTADEAELKELIIGYGLSWEMVPSEALNKISTWDALFFANSVPYGALLRNLSRLSKIGYIKPLAKGTSHVVAMLTDKDGITRSRIHPITILVAMKAYAAGGSWGKDQSRWETPKSTWPVEQRIIDALDTAFYTAFGNVESAGKRTLIGLDISGSMGNGHVQGAENLTAREATAAISMVLARTEPETHIIGFTGSYNYGREARRSGYGWGAASSTVSGAVQELDIRPTQRLDSVVQKISHLPMGPTDCALPMLYALEKGLEVDTFVILTDNETWVGPIHPFEALKKYRETTGIPARLVVLSTEASRFSIADPSDAGMLDIPGFDSAVPNILNEFSRGDL